MKQKATVSRGTLWTVLPMLLTRINDILESMEQCGEEHREYYDFNNDLLKEYVQAHNEISRVLGIGETKTESE